MNAHGRGGKHALRIEEIRSECKILVGKHENEE
jgi:hypothetical protein